MTVDASAVIGVIKPFTGFNGAPDTPPPAPPRPLPPGVTPPGAGAGAGNAAAFARLTPEQNATFYRQLGITESRTHDTGAGDTMYGADVNPNVIFPDKTADPENPASYNFGPTDRIMTSMEAIGVDPFFRVGDGHDGFVPDFDKYAEVVRHIVLHYNKGWAGGFRYNIKYWEFWNEPDFTIPGRAQFWAGNAQQYYEFYGKVALAIKRADPTAWVGGPATASDSVEFQGPFLEYLRLHKLPFDFYTYHYYSIGSADPYDVVRLTDKIRAALVKSGFGKAPIMITEYGYDLFEPSTGAQRPAFFSAELAYMQDTSMDRAYYHSAGVGRLFSADGLTPAGLVYQAHASLQATPQRLKTSGGDDIGFHVLAGRATPTSSDTSEEVRIIITNYEIPKDKRGPYENGQGMPQAAPYKGDLVLRYPKSQVELHVLPRRDPHYTQNGGYDLTVNALPAWANEGYIVSRYRLDGAQSMTLVDSGKGQGRTLKLSADLPPPAVELIVIRSARAGAPTREGIWKPRSETSQGR